MTERRFDPKKSPKVKKAVNVYENIFVCIF